MQISSPGAQLVVSIETSIACGGIFHLMKNLTIKFVLEIGVVSVIGMVVHRDRQIAFI